MNMIVNSHKHCFICAEEKVFTDEHILPNWILKRFKLHPQSFELPNRLNFHYGRYKLNCCRECNQLLSQELENPVSRLFRTPYEGIIKSIEKDRALKVLLFKWMALIFFKCVLKEKDFILNPKDRNDKTKVAHLHNWTDLHFVHAVARSPYTRAHIVNNAVGSLFIYKVAKIGNFVPFDFAFYPKGKTLLLSLGDTCLIFALNDTGVLASEIKVPFIKEYHPLHLIEVFCLLTSLNLAMEERPFFTYELTAKKQLTISGKNRGVSTYNESMAKTSYDTILNRMSAAMVKQFIQPKNREEILEKLEKGGGFSFFSVR